MLNPGSERGLRFRLPFAAMAILVALAVAATQSMQAQTFTNLHSFTNGGDGKTPFAGPTMDVAGNIYTGFEDGGFPMATMTIDQAGNLYGTTYYGSVLSWFDPERAGREYPVHLSQWR